MNLLADFYRPSSEVNDIACFVTSISCQIIKNTYNYEGSPEYERSKPYAAFTLSRKVSEKTKKLVHISKKIACYEKSSCQQRHYNFKQIREHIHLHVSLFSFDTSYS